MNGRAGSNRWATARDSITAADRLVAASCGDANRWQGSRRQGEGEAREGQGPMAPVLRRCSAPDVSRP